MAACGACGHFGGGAAQTSGGPNGSGRAMAQGGRRHCRSSGVSAGFLGGPGDAGRGSAGPENGCAGESGGSTGGEAEI